MSRNLDARESDSPCNLAQTPIRSHDAPRVSIFSHLCRSKSPPPRPSPPLPPVHFLAVSHRNALLHPAVPNPYPPSNTSMPAMLGTSSDVTSPSQQMIRHVIHPALLLSVHAMSPFSYVASYSCMNSPPSLAPSKLTLFCAARSKVSSRYLSM